MRKLLGAVGPFLAASHRAFNPPPLTGDLSRQGNLGVTRTQAAIRVVEWPDDTGWASSRLIAISNSTPSRTAAEAESREGSWLRVFSTVNDHRVFGDSVPGRLSKRSNLVARRAGRGTPGRWFRKASNSAQAAGIPSIMDAASPLYRASLAGVRMDRARDRRRSCAESVTRGGDPTGHPNRKGGLCILSYWNV